MSRCTLNLVILAAGKGERFAIEGVNVSKPLIEFFGRSLLLHTVELAQHIGLMIQGPYQIIVVGTELVTQAAEHIPGVTRTVPVTVTQPGPVASAVLALAHCQPEDPIVFLDCDNFYPGPRDWISKLPIGTNFVTVAPAPTGLSVRDFLNVQDQEGLVMCLEEKAGLPNCRVGTGIYGFESSARFRTSAAGSFCSSASLGRKELPMSAVTKEAMVGSQVQAAEASPWLPIGTPQQMMEAARVIDSDYPG